MGMGVQRSVIVERQQFPSAPFSRHVNLLAGGRQVIGKSSAARPAGIDLLFFLLSCCTSRSHDKALLARLRLHRQQTCVSLALHTLRHWSASVYFVRSNPASFGVHSSPASQASTARNLPLFQLTMASRKPNLHVVMPDCSQASRDFGILQGGIRSPRSPRFREVFDAPFSEALMNASRTTLATDSSGSYPCPDQHNGLEMETKRHASHGSMRSKNQSQSSSPLQWRQDSWTSSEATRRASVNDRIRDWARKSFTFSRKNSEQSDDGYFGHSQRRSSKSAVVTPTSETSTPYSFASPDRYSRPVVAVAEVDEPR